MYTTVKGKLKYDFILGEDGKIYRLYHDTNITCQGYFLLQFYGEFYELIRIFELS
jgi:hypothetical protein